MTKDVDKPDKKKSDQFKPYYPHRQRAGRGKGKSGTATASLTSALNAPRHLAAQPRETMEPALVRAVERCSELEGQIKVTDAKRQLLQAQLMEARRVGEVEQQKMDNVLGAAKAAPILETTVDTAATAIISDEEQQDEEKDGKQGKDKKKDDGAGTGEA